MKFEWDADKAEANLAKHGVSFEAATELDWGLALVVPQTVGGEQRNSALALLGDRVHICIYTGRDNVRRIISLRKANRREVRRYLEALESSGKSTSRRMRKTLRSPPQPRAILTFRLLPMNSLPGCGRSTHALSRWRNCAGSKRSCCAPMGRNGAR